MIRKLKINFTILGSLLCFLFPVVSFSHTYYFSFAEVEYNIMQERLEGTIVFTTHDLEEYLIENNIITNKFYKLDHDSCTINKIGEKIFENFNFYNSNGKIELNSLEFSTTRNGLFEFYFTSERIINEGQLELDFSCLMDKFPKQQNKLTFIHKGEKKTYEFLIINERKKIINE
jgi:hypothetical protein